MSILRYEEIPVKQVKTGHRHRHDNGDLPAMAKAVKARGGLIQPIAVTTDRLLVVGGRRLEVAKILKWQTIPAVVIDCDAEDIPFYEWDENEVRKGFTISEKVSIGKAIEKALLEKERRGRPILGPNEPNTKESGKSSEMAAKEADFSSRAQYERAKTVTDKGTPELVEQMDQGKISVSAAAKAAALPDGQQQKVVDRIKAGMKGSEAVKTRKKPKHSIWHRMVLALGAVSRLIDAAAHEDRHNRYADSIRKSLQLARNTISAWEKASSPP